MDAEKYQTIAQKCFAALPFLIMLWLEMVLNYYAAPQGMIFISPYLLAFFSAGILSLFALLKGDMCRGQLSRYFILLPFFLIFGLGNFLYTLAFTPRHVAALIYSLAGLLLPLVFFFFKYDEKDEPLSRWVMKIGIAVAALGSLQFLLVLFVELPSAFNFQRANPFAQLLLGSTLAAWLLSLAKSRLKGYIKLLLKSNFVLLVLNYCWLMFTLYLQYQHSPHFIAESLGNFVLLVIYQLIILANLAYLLLAKKGEELRSIPAWTTLLVLTGIYPLLMLM